MVKVVARAAVRRMDMRGFGEDLTCQTKHAIIDFAKTKPGRFF